MRIPEFQQSAVCNHMCPSCGKALERRPKENDDKFAIRVFCGRPCWMASRRRSGKKIHQVLASKSG